MNDTTVSFSTSLQQYGFIDYSVCRTIQNVHMGTAEVTEVEATILGPGGEALVSENLVPYERTLGYLAGYSGCRGTVRDTNQSHPIATRYRLRYSVRYDDGLTGNIVGEAAIEAR